MLVLAAATRHTLSYASGVIANLLDGPDLIKTISLIAISTILISFNVSSSYVFNAYAQTQSGPATSGQATGGPAIGGTAPCYGTCNYYGGPATSGPANSGAANSGPAKGGTANSGPAKGGTSNSGPSSTPSQNTPNTNPTTVNLIGSWSYSGTNHHNGRSVSSDITFYPSGKYRVIGSVSNQDGRFNFDSYSNTITLYDSRVILGRPGPVVWPMTNIQENSFDVTTETINFHFVRSQ
jgi:hypothetical protein